MKLIKNAIVYRASLPSAGELAKHLAEKPFEPILETMSHSYGFVPNPATGELVTEVACGLSFRFRLDEKILPKAAVKAEVMARIEAREIELERAMDKAELDQLRTDVLAELVSKALSSRTEVNAFYHADSRTLILPVTNKTLASTVLGALVQACGAVETSTIHVSDVKGGLTARLLAYFQDDDREAFNGFRIGDSVLMKGSQGRASFDLDNLDHARKGVVESLASSMQAERLALVHADAVSFKLTKDFHLRGISFLLEPSEEELESQGDIDAAQQWRNEAGVQLIQIVSLVQALCDLFGYQEKPLESSTETDSDKAGDSLYESALAFVRESGRASISAVQRKLKIGYNHAARLIEEMESAGAVSHMKPDGSRSVI